MASIISPARAKRAGSNSQAQSSSMAADRLGRSPQIVPIRNTAIIRRLRSAPPIPGLIARQSCANSASSRGRGGRLSPTRSIAC